MTTISNMTVGVAKRYRWIALVSVFDERAQYVAIRGVSSNGTEDRVKHGEDEVVGVG